MLTNRTVVKSDAEAAIKGKQWMLSSYGPFKDKPSLPNFVEDQSFEEIRSLCYNAKNNGNLQALLPQLQQQTADASYKISMLCDLNNVNNNLLNVLVNLYDSGDSTVNTQTTQNSQNSTSNPFAVASNSGGSQTSGLFGANTTQQQNPFGSSSIFGSSSTTPSSTSSGIFGGGNSSSTVASNNIFGQQQQPAFGSSGASIFGGQNAFGSGGNVANSFGASSFSQPSASPFSLSQIAQPKDTPINQSSMFGASPFQQTQNSIFGAAPGFGNQIQPTKPSGLFSSQSTNSMFGQSQPAPTSGLFGQANNTNQPANTGNLFSSFAAPSQPQPQQQGLFGAVSENKSIFGQSANSNQSMFGANQQQTNQSSNIFANALAQQQTNTQSVFGVSNQQPEQQQSIFSQSNSNTGGSNIFQNQANVPPVLGGSAFGGNSGFGQTEQVSQSAYSKIEDLSSEDLELFRADHFVIRRIPTVPPPKELCF